MESTPCETGAFAISDKPINPLRQRMIDDMTARRFSEKVQKAYVRHVRTFTAFPRHRTFVLVRIA
jgi:hypothetical protein